MVVDKVGPKMYKNFDKMRLIMFDPEKAKKINRSASTNAMVTGKQGNIPRDSSFDNIGPRRNFRMASTKDATEGIGDSNSRASFNNPVSETDYALDYLDELELNRAFEVFKDI